MRIILLCLASGLLSLASAAERRPNILILFADDLGRYASAYADPEAPSHNDVICTPTFDRIAKEGALAANAFVSAPSCSPCRAALVSGRHFFRNGSCSQLHHKWHGGEPDPWMQVKGYAKLLEAGGYHVGLTHKNHVKNNPFGPQYNKAGRRVNGFSQFVSKAEEQAAAKERIYEECRNNFRDFLKDREDGQPFLYIMNLKADRTPMGDLRRLAEPGEPTFEQVEGNTRVTYADVDAGPTKAWMIENRFDPRYNWHWELGFGQRPAEELYDLSKDPHQVVNLARDPAYEEQRAALREILIAELKANDDPRLNGDQFDHPPYCRVGFREVD